MATFRFELDHRPTRNKTYNLYMMVTVGSKRTKKKTGLQLKKIDDFNPRCKGNNWIRANVPEAKVWNEKLRLMLVEANETYNKLENKGEVSANQVIKELNKEIISPSFIKFAKERTQMLFDQGGIRTWKKYNSFLNKLEAFRKKRKIKDITVDDLTPDFLTKFDNFLHKLENEREKGKLLHPNTIQVHFKTFQALVNRAIEIGILDVSKNPFLSFKYKGTKTVKEKLETDEIEKIINLELEENSLLWHCRNYFLFSFYCAGIRAADLIQLRWSNVENDRLHYQMDKNNKERNMILVPQAINILKEYKKEDSKISDYIFPLLSNEAEYAIYCSQADKDRMKPELKKKMLSDISAKNALINKYLKKIAEKADISKPLSMHISRHSFAHLAQNTGVESFAIKDILGHSNLATTEKYMGEFDNSRTDKTLQSLFSKSEEKTPISKEAQIIEMLKELSPEQIASIMNSINK